ncbi:jg2524 [Pararge aegeria aegeria]|uniref:Jg2524 protein n=1 Tax=Pararge aegeria aegeria TaxID=348720 RepID=A0A8S4RYT6_9NEOP|nr:jg2524 [Pararge aegeria aegeria]
MIAKVFFVLVFGYIASVVYTTPLDEQKPFKCPPNEKYYKCSLEVCYKKCDNIANPPPCPQIAANCFKPSCECIDHYLRDKEGGQCIPEENCPQFEKLKLVP